MLPSTTKTKMHSRRVCWNWNAIAAIAASLSSVFALITVYLFFSYQKEERKRLRPYLAIQDVYIDQTLGRDLRLEITFINQGPIPAKGLGGRILFIDTEKDRAKEREYRLNIVNDIPPAIARPWVLLGIKYPMEADRYYIYISFDYRDPITTAKYSQHFYLVGLGVREGVTTSTFVDATPDEKASIDEYLGTK